MTEVLQQQLFEEGKELYKLRDLSCPEECLMGLGICCPDEWFPQLLALTRILERHNKLHPENAVHATQVKCKFGGLRFHTDHRDTGDEDFIFIIEVFEEMLGSPKMRKNLQWSFGEYIVNNDTQHGGAHEFHF